MGQKKLEMECDYLLCNNFCFIFNFYPWVMTFFFISELVEPVSYRIDSILSHKVPVRFPVEFNID